MLLHQKDIIEFLDYNNANSMKNRIILKEFFDKAADACLEEAEIRPNEKSGLKYAFTILKIK